MNINWKVRFKNAAWLGPFLTFIVGTIFQFLAMFDIFPKITQAEVMQIVTAVLQLLGILGIIVDPTTKGIGDSERALSYTEPN